MSEYSHSIRLSEYSMAFNGDNEIKRYKDLVEQAKKELDEDQNDKDQLNGIRLDAVCEILETSDFQNRDFCRDLTKLNHEYDPSEPNAETIIQEAQRILRLAYFDAEGTPEGEELAKFLLTVIKSMGIKHRGYFKNENGITSFVHKEEVFEIDKKSTANLTTPQKLEWLHDISKHRKIRVFGYKRLKEAVHDAEEEAASEHEGNMSLYNAALNESFLENENVAFVYFFIRKEPLSPESMKKLTKKEKTRLSEIKKLIETDTLSKDLTEEPVFIKAIELVQADPTFKKNALLYIAEVAEAKSESFFQKGGFEEGEDRINESHQAALTLQNELYPENNNSNISGQKRNETEDKGSPSPKPKRNK